MNCLVREKLTSSELENKELSKLWHLAQAYNISNSFLGRKDSSDKNFLWSKIILNDKKKLALLNSLIGRDRETIFAMIRNIEEEEMNEEVVSAVEEDAIAVYEWF